uniref:Uncharacterized protein n=1 Tax=Anguilla anguilla TaxID=7936 RepID=A0A0E9SMG0_ANGAN
MATGRDSSNSSSSSSSSGFFLYRSRGAGVLLDASLRACRTFFCSFRYFFGSALLLELTVPRFVFKF